MAGNSDDDGTQERRCKTVPLAIEMTTTEQAIVMTSGSATPEDIAERFDRDVRNIHRNKPIMDAIYLAKACRREPPPL